MTPSSGGYLPVGGSPDSRMSHWATFKLTRNGPTSFAFLAIALLTGLFGGYMLAGPPRGTELCTLPFDTFNAPFDHSFPQNIPPPSADPSYQSGDESLLVSDDLDLEELRSMVTGTRGYYARDYSMNLGWNNVSHPVCRCLWRLSTSRCVISSRQLSTMVRSLTALS